MTYLVARSGPDFALVGSDTRWMVRRDGDETAVDAGGKVWPLTRGWAASSARPDGSLTCKLQRAHLSEGVDAGDLMALRDTIMSVHNQQRGEPAGSGSAGEDPPGQGGHFFAATNGTRFGVVAFHLDGSEIPEIRRHGVGTSLSPRMAELDEEDTHPCLEVLREGEGRYQAVAAARRSIRLASELADDVSAEPQVGLLYRTMDGVSFRFL